jgi:uncharacterized protein involved in exopolysaccharide biosynthesis
MGVSLSDLWRPIARHKRLVVLVTLASTAMAGTASFLVTPKFRAEVVLSVAEQRQTPLGAIAGQFGDFGGLSALGLFEDTDKAAAIATLKSRQVTEQFIVEEGLLPVLFEDEWDAQKRGWKGEPPTPWHAYELFDRRVRAVQEDRRSGLVTLTIEWKNPQLAAAWANELVRRTNRKLQQDSVGEAQKTILFLEDQIAKARLVEVRQALFALVESEMKRMAVAHSREEFALRVIDPAVEPKRRSSPRRLLMAALGLPVGAFCSLLLVAWRESARLPG